MGDPTDEQIQSARNTLKTTLNDLDGLGSLSYQREVWGPGIRMGYTEFVDLMFDQIEDARLNKWAPLVGMDEQQTDAVRALERRLFAFSESHENPSVGELHANPEWIAIMQQSNAIAKMLRQLH